MKQWRRRLVVLAAALAGLWLVSGVVEVTRMTALPGGVRVFGLGRGALTFVEGDRSLLNLDRFLRIEREGAAWEFSAHRPGWERLAWRPAVVAGPPPTLFSLRPAPTTLLGMWPAPRRVEYALPLWMPAGAAALAAAVLHLPRLVRPGCCRACRYDLAGLPAGGACPECGARP